MRVQARHVNQARRHVEAAEKRVLAQQALLMKATLIERDAPWKQSLLDRFAETLSTFERTLGAMQAHLAVEERAYREGSH